MSDASIAVVFSADTGQYVANIEGMDAATAKSAQAVAQAKNLIKTSLAEQAEAAMKTGASANQLSNIQQRAAARMASVTEDNANKIIGSLNRISDKNKAVAAELANLKVPEPPEMSDITNRMRASALLRGGGLRAGENFASQFDAFNKIATIAFPVLGLATLGEEAAKFGKELYDAFDMGGARARQTASEVQSVTNALNESSTLLDLQIDKLQQEQAKLEKKPFNGLKLALDEAAQASENLQKKLAATLETELKVIAGMSSSLPQQILTGGSDTHQEQVMVGEHSKYLSQAVTVQDQLNESTSYGVALQTRLAELHANAKLNSEANANNAEGAGQLTTYTEEIKAVQQLIGWQGQEHSNILKTIDLQKQQASTQAARDKHGADVSAHAGNEAASKAAQARLRSMETYINQWQLLAPVSAKAIYDYWEVQRSTFTQGSTEYNTIVSKQAEIAVEGARKVHDAIEKYKESQKREVTNPFALDRNVNVMGNNPETAHALSDAQAKSALSADEVTASIAKTKVQIELANGSVSKFAATQQLAAIDAQLHAQRIAELNRQIADLKKTSGSYNAVTDTFGSNKDQKDYVGLQSQVTKESGQASVDAMQSSAQLAGETWSGALKNANAEFLQNSRDTASQVTDVFKQAVDGINDQLSDLLTGKKTNWSSMLSGVAKSLATDGLKQGEAGIAGLFQPKPATDGSTSTSSPVGGLLSAITGVGKPSGTQSNPFFVTMTGGGTDSAGKGLGSLFGKIKGGGDDDGDDDDDDDDSDDSGASTAVGLLGTVGKFIAKAFGGNKAIGGDVSPGHIYRINEQGQELFAPSTSGKIIPAKSWGNGGDGGGAHYTINTGGVSSEEVDMRVRSALTVYHTKVMPHGARQAVADGNGRRSGHR